MPIKMPGKVLAFLLTCLMTAPAAALQWKSGPETVPLVELFTSQGCSSCPPADAWLGSLGERDDLWRAYVPVAWHVDYWNRMGWADPFSRPAFSARQRAYREAEAVRVVYTPGVFVGGKEWRRWRLPPASIPSPAEAVGTLALRLDRNRAQLTFEPVAGFPVHGLQAHLVLLGMGLETRVQRGENSGRVLQEDFVVLGTTHSGAESRSLTRWRLGLPSGDDHGAKRLAVAAWISRGNDPRPLQAVGGWLP